ncbi:MAG: CCA tRNA nucleotidyltransferase [Christensenellaceae bacterium]|jgi:tRNA nucleotidyltransferase (CCA-adding enzyme)|nr:CCA tRNA nucleotidyltransferase [Christensenellaceae bacterium]
MQNAFPTELTELARMLQRAGFSLYAVGGMVRNAQLGLPLHDMDIASALRPSDLIRLCERETIRYVPKGIAFGMIELHMGEQRFEHTTFRADRYAQDGRHRPSEIAFADTVEEDAFRRDFTINALYQNVRSGAVLDPTGGINDLKAGILRATSPDPSIIMRDDALRILRMARFAAELGFAVEPGTYEAARAQVEGLKDISAERVQGELNAILLSDVKYGKQGAVYHGLRMLCDLGAMDCILPELTKGRGVAQREEYHAYDVLEHGLHAAQCAPPNLTLRLAALLHDVGKPGALNDSGHMLGHDALGAEMAQGILERLRYPAQTVLRVRELVAWHMYDLTGKAAEPTLRARFAQWGYELSCQLAALRRADIRGSGRNGSEKTADTWERILCAMQKEGAPFSTAELNITGEDIMRALGLPPGPQVGEIKQRLLLHCARRPADNKKERLLRVAKTML